MGRRSGIAMVLTCLVLGAGAGAAVGGCGEDRGSVEIEGGTTGTVGTSTTGTSTTGTSTTGTSTTGTSTTETDTTEGRGPGY